MNTDNLIIIAVVLLIITGVVIYLYKAKKRGEACIGCPYAKQCKGACNGNCDGNGQ